MYNFFDIYRKVYLLSNKCLTEIILMELDFGDDEFTDYYVNF